jgi:type III secretory pathway component EscS
MNGITTAITSLQSQLLTVVVPVAVISVILWFIANALAPILPEWAQTVRGHFQKVMLGVMLVGGATTIITAMYGMISGGA